MLVPGAISPPSFTVTRPTSAPLPASIPPSATVTGPPPAPLVARKLTLVPLGTALPELVVRLSPMTLFTESIEVIWVPVEIFVPEMT